MDEDIRCRRSFLQCATSACQKQWSGKNKANRICMTCLKVAILSGSEVVCGQTPSMSSKSPKRHLGTANTIFLFFSLMSVPSSQFPLVVR
ncbi:hypothetical protein GCK32_011296 [Trichostrongylus colubriformis]|uniref:Uncharacterized protein n=1 Tax=Trichostrongylus colubriformis TaxID=6319 RepID=A0AAN8FGV0_TRICO